jgi:formylmethanofuran dehydrogenase subunit D
MLRFAKFLKRVRVRLITARDAFQIESANADKFDELFVERSAVIFLHPDVAKTYGFEDRQIVRVTAKDRSLNLKLRISETAPKDGALMPKSIYSNYLSSEEVTIEQAEGEVTTISELIQMFGNV